MPPSLRAVIADEFPRDVTRAAALIAELLRRHDFDRAFALRLFATSRNADASHELRCLASLAVEHQFLLAGRDEAASLLRAIGVADDEELIRRRIARNKPIHNQLRDGASGLRSFLHHT